MNILCFISSSPVIIVTLSLYYPLFLSSIFENVPMFLARISYRTLPTWVNILSILEVVPVSVIAWVPTTSILRTLGYRSLLPILMIQIRRPTVRPSQN